MKTVFLNTNELNEALVTVFKSTKNLFYQELKPGLITWLVVHNKDLA